jgi:hypothetical protein
MSEILEKAQETLREATDEGTKLPELDENDNIMQSSYNKTDPLAKSFYTTNTASYEQDDINITPRLSKISLTLLMLGLSLSMFLIALDFVVLQSNVANGEEYFVDGYPQNHR